ncbi:redoxin domain-containing protein [Haloechinothrix halophila]|uniref:redoxin domain-containing protein n=1 Tax=Haloechinothrix halophila TaxID=1069073 RepID=UPI00041D59EB|nr:redoxin domain-containing protein [Haloechinothrix halophila]
MPVLRMIAVALSGLLVLAACGTATETNAGNGSGGVPPQLNFTATTLDGDEFSGETLAGEPAVLWFWTPWCAVCQHEAGFIADMADKHGDTVTFVGVAAQDNVEAMRAFANRFGIDSFTNLNDKDGSVWAAFEVPAQPAFAFISASGDVERVNGTVTEQEMERWITTRAQA